MKICMIAQFPPPIHGLSKAVETLFNSRIRSHDEVEKIDITNNFKFLFNLWRVAKSKADIYYLTISQTKMGNLRDLLILRLLTIQNKRCIIHLHGGYYRELVDHDLNPIQRKANYRIIGKLSGAIVLGKSLVNMFDGMIPSNRIYVVPNCVDDVYVINDSIMKQKTELIQSGGMKHVLYLSNFIESKGYMKVLELALMEKKRTIDGRQPKLFFDFAGKFFRASDRRQFENYIRDHGLESLVAYHGIVLGAKKRQLLSLSSIFVLLTNYPKEGQPISILEAMGNGMMVVTTDQAGIPDVVVDGENGFVEPSRNIDVARCYSRLLQISDREVVDIMQRNRRKVLKDYTENQYIEKMANIFNQLQNN